MGLYPSVSPDCKNLIYYGGGVRKAMINYFSLKMISLEDFSIENLFQYK